MIEIDSLERRSIVIGERPMASVKRRDLFMMAWVKDDPTQPLTILRKHGLRARRQVIQKRMAIVIGLGGS